MGREPAIQNGIMNLYALAPLIAGLLNLILVYWVYRQAPEGKLRRVFLLWNLWIGFWNAGITVGYLMQDPATANRWYWATVPATISFIPPLFLHFTALLVEKVRPVPRWPVPSAYLAGALFVLFGTGTTFLIGPVQRYFWGFYPLAGSGAWLFGMVWFLTVGYAFWILISGIRHASGYYRNQLEYVLLGAGMGFGSGSTNFLPLYGFAVYPVGNLLNALFSLLLAYAIVEYNLMDIRVAVRRSAVHGALAGTLTLVYLFIVSVLRRLFGHYGVEESYVYYTAAFPMTVVFLPAVKAGIEPWLDRSTVRASYRHAEVLKNFAQSILNVLDAKVIASRILEELSAALRVDMGVVYAQTTGHSRWSFVASQGLPEPPASEPAHAVLRHVYSHPGPFVKERALWKYDARKHPDSAAWLREIQLWPYAITLPLWVGTRLVGVLGLGEKVTGEMFTQDDLALANALTDHGALALANAEHIAELESRKRALKESHDAVLMGILATEMAHELAKPLTHILNEESRLESKVEGPSLQSLRKIEREAQRAAEILDGFAMLSPHRPLPRAPVVIPELLDEALSTLGLQDAPELHIERDYELTAPVLANRSQLLQVFSNVIQNAWQSMPEGGALSLRVRPGPVTAQGPSIEIAISDTGPGIPREIQNKVFDPFFTTKQARGGRGVGLTLSRAIMERHRGSIALESPVHENKGTRAVLRLPLDIKD